MCKYLLKTQLNVRNSFFLMDIMNQAVHPAVIHKYSQIDVMQIC
jgi:hypothetical protein